MAESESENQWKRGVILPVGVNHRMTASCRHHWAWVTMKHFGEKVSLVFDAFPSQMIHSCQVEEVIENLTIKV